METFDKVHKWLSNVETGVTATRLMKQKCAAQRYNFWNKQYYSLKYAIGDLMITGKIKMIKFGETVPKAIEKFMTQKTNISSFMMAFSGARTEEAHAIYIKNPQMAASMNTLIIAWDASMRKLVIERIIDDKTLTKAAWKSTDYIGVINLMRINENKKPFAFDSDQFIAQFHHFTLFPGQMSIPIAANSMLPNETETILPLTTKKLYTKAPKTAVYNDRALCYGCGKSGHIHKDCPEGTYSKYYKQNKIKKKKKRDKERRDRGRGNYKNDRRRNSQQKREKRYETTRSPSRSRYTRRQSPSRSRSRSRSIHKERSKRDSSKSERTTTVCRHYKHNACNNGLRSRDCNAGAHICPHCGKNGSHYPKNCHEKDRKHRTY